MAPEVVVAPLWGLLALVVAEHPCTIDVSAEMLVSSAYQPSVAASGLLHGWVTGWVVRPRGRLGS